MEFESVTLRPFFTSATPGMVVPDCRSDKAGAGVVGPDALVRIGREMKASQDPGRESGGRVVDAMCLRIMLIDAKIRSVYSRPVPGLKLGPDAGSIPSIARIHGDEGMGACGLAQRT